MRILPLSAALAASLLASAARAAVIPSDLAPGSTFYVLFVSTSTTDGTSSTPATYDALATSDATAANLNATFGNATTWHALVSTADGTTAISRFNPSAPIYLPDGTRIANSGADLWNTNNASLLHAVNELADTTSTTSPTVWTGTAANGGGESGIGGPKSLGGSNSTTGTSAAENGSTTAIDSTWIENGSPIQDTRLPIYAFSSPITVPAPEPSSIALLALATPALLRRRKR